jgi:hypothetical protein
MPETVSHALRELGNPHYRHLVLQPFLLHGLVLCALFTMASAVLGQGRAAAFGLVMLAGCAGVLWPYLEARAAAEPALQAVQSKYAVSDVAGIGSRLRDERWVWLALAGSCVLALAALPTRSAFAVAACLVAGCFGIGLGLWNLQFHFREARLHYPGINEVPGRAVEAPAEIKDKEDAR